MGLGAKNKWGLYDLHGHVLQWCHDEWGEEWNKTRPTFRRAIDGEGDTVQTGRGSDYAEGLEVMLADGRLRAMRGGSWHNTASICRSAYRAGGHPGERAGNLGFRVCLAPGPGIARAEPKPDQQGAEAKSDAPGAAGAGGVDLDLARERISPPPQVAEN